MWKCHSYLFYVFIPWKKQASIVSGPCGSVSICNAERKQLLFLSLFFSLSLSFIFFSLFSLCLVLFVYWDIITCCQVPRYDSHLHILNMFLGSCWDTDCYPLMFLFCTHFIVHPSSLVLPFAFYPHWMCVKCHIWMCGMSGEQTKSCTAYMPASCVFWNTISLC